MITPFFSFVFLQLFYHDSLTEKNKPIPLPDTQQIDRAITTTDYIKPKETHKIGVLYVGPDQDTEEEILSNSVGSLRYMFFIRVSYDNWFMWLAAGRTVSAEFPKSSDIYCQQYLHKTTKTNPDLFLRDLA